MPRRVKSKRAKKSQRQRKTRNKMYGGELIGSGNNTCVYNPPIECVDNSEIPPGHVSRIVPSDSIEPTAQAKIQVALAKMDPKYQKHFNFATKICKAKFKQTDLDKQCTVEKLSDTVKVGDTDLINMLTPIQQSDINRRDGTLYKNVEKTNAALTEFLHALVEMNSYSVQVYHTDAHLGNFSWKDDTIVLHDWEKTIVGDANLLIEVNGSTQSSWHILGYPPKLYERKYLEGFPCWNQIIEVIENTIDRYQGVFPQNHNEVHFAHEILFRFWDLFSIMNPLYEVYIAAGKNVPAFIKLIDKNVRNYYYDTFLDELLADANLEYRKTKMNEITNKIHALIDAATATATATTNEKTAIDAELLKLVAKHANSSPSKKVLQNMLGQSNL